MQSAVMLVLGALALFQLKHFACDFALQTTRQIQAKGNYGQLGGVQHAGLHALGSLPALLVLTQSAPLIAGIMLGEFVIHYHVDWSKARIDKARRLNDTTTAYWVVFGFDQLVHQMTYLGIVVLIFMVG